MIDYDKLKIVHELAQKYSSKIDSIVQIILEFNPGCNMYGFRSYDFPNENLFMSIDMLIQKLHELTQPKPRFEEFDSIYYRIGDEIHDSTINHVFDGMMQNERFYRTGKCHDMLESQLYLKKSELIEAQIAYWSKLHEEENPGDLIICKRKELEFKATDAWYKQAAKDEDDHHEKYPHDQSLHEIPGQNSIVCEHESDGHTYPLQPQNKYKKCKKCGEFYR